MRLFISYARVDKPYCIQIIETLDVHEIWYDQRVYAGQNWWQEILRRLDWCEGFIYLISPESLASEYCRKEYDLARDLGRQIFPVLVRENTVIPALLSSVPSIDLSKGLTPEGVRSLLSAIYLAERQQTPGLHVSAMSVEQAKQPPIDPATVIKTAASAMEKGLFDQAVFLLRQAKNSGVISRFINLDMILKEAETNLARQSHRLEAEREYKQIAELLKHKRTSKLGWEAFRAFKKDFPDYDPEQLAALSPDAAGYAEPSKAASPPSVPSPLPASPATTTSGSLTPRGFIVREAGGEKPEKLGTAQTPSQSVQFSAYYPKEVAPREWQPLHAYIFQQQVVRSVTEDADRLLGERRSGFRLFGRSAQAPVQEGALVTVTPDIPGFEFNPPNVRSRFYKDWHRFDFEVRAQDARLNQSANGLLTFAIEGIIVADIPLSIFVKEKAEKTAAPACATINPYQAIFCSYSYQDKQIVERAERFYKALGNNFLRDVVSLKSGQDWAEELLSLIDHADVFQLFWSQAASQSQHVRKEWEHALKLAAARKNFIRPVYWQEPKPPIPTPLKHIHFSFQPDLSK